MVLYMEPHLTAMGCHLGSQSVTFHSAQVKTLHLNPSQAVWY